MGTFTLPEANSLTLKLVGANLEYDRFRLFGELPAYFQVLLLLGEGFPGTPKVKNFRGLSAVKGLRVIHLFYRPALSLVENEC